ncbi:MAG: hypothetical protein IKQ06_02170 [Bacilli bacterium]|nr:hypothetical protein [Bacilli bacterium]
MAKNKPYKYNSKSRLTQNSQSFPFKVKSMKKDVKENLENTLTKLKIIDDTSKEEEKLEGDFLKDRFNKKNDKKKKDNNKEKEKVKEKDKSKDKKEDKEKIDNKTKEKEKDNEKFIEKITFFRKLFLTMSLVCAILLLVLFGANFISKQFPNVFGSAKNRIIVKDKKSENIVDDNYLFVGDFYTKEFVFKNYGSDYHYVNVSTDTLTTQELLNHMKDMVYDYNPSVVFLEIGIMDMEIGVGEEEFIRNYGHIIDLIKSNRPNAVIIVESIYPLADGYEDGFFKGDITNKKIESRNKAIMNLAKTKDVEYLDLHSLLVKKGELNAKYTNDGIHLNKEGYQVLYQEINSIVG